MGPPPAVARVRRAVRSVLEGLPGDSLVLVACSGGADSLALAAAAAFEAPRRGLRAGAVTVDHGLQAGSARRAESLVSRLRGCGLMPVEVLTVRVEGAGGPEAAARIARYRALDEAAARLGATVVLLGHTRDDQAETVLLGLARGSGPRSLAGMPPVSGIYRRPLLDVERVTTRAACAAGGLEVWDDPHNEDPRFTRSRVRSELLPAMDDVLGGGVTAALARTAGLCRDDAEALDTWAEEARAAATVSRRPDVGLDVEVLAGLPAAVRGRVLRLAAVAAGSPPGTLAAVHVRAAEALVMNWRGQRGADLPGGVTARRRRGRLLFQRDNDQQHCSREAQQSSQDSSPSS